jgi:hypothetical protein
VSGTGHKAKELGTGPQKVENLGKEEEEQCLAKVAQNSHDSKGHAAKVAKGIADKNA